MIWLSAFRPNVPNEPPHSALAVPAEHADLLRRTQQQGSSIDRFQPRRRERFRTWTSHRSLSPITAILTGGDGAHRGAAELLQDYLQRAFRIRLPIDPHALSPGPHVGNVILLGPGACRLAGWVTPQELAYVGRGGFVLHAWQGRVALAGPDAEGTAAAVRRWLEDHHVRLFGPGIAQIADMSGDFLHELYALDRPWFDNRPPWEAWRPQPEGSQTATSGLDRGAALRVAEAIKDLARRGQRHAPEGLLEAADTSAMSRYVAAQLLRNPFLDARRLTRQYAAAHALAGQPRDFE
jgi:hypothetical protein